MTGRSPLREEGSSANARACLQRLLRPSGPPSPPPPRPSPLPPFSGPRGGLPEGPPLPNRQGPRPGGTPGGGRGVLGPTGGRGAAPRPKIWFFFATELCGGFSLRMETIGFRGPKVVSQGDAGRCRRLFFWASGGCFLPFWPFLATFAPFRSFSAPFWPIALHQCGVPPPKKIPVPSTRVHSQSILADPTPQGGGLGLKTSQSLR